MIKTIIAKPVDIVEMETEFSAVCPVDHSVDEYTVRIRYRPRCDDGGNCVYAELGSLREYLDGFRGRVIYHEDLINELVRELVESLRPIEISVELTSRYRGITYVLRRSFSMQGHQHGS